MSPEDGPRVLPGCKSDSYLKVGISDIDYVKDLRKEFTAYLSSLRPTEHCVLEKASQESLQQVTPSCSQSSVTEYSVDSRSYLSQEEDSDDILALLDEMHDKAAAEWKNQDQWWEVDETNLAFEETLGSPRVTKREDTEMVKLLEQMEYTATSEWNTSLKEFFSQDLDEKPVIEKVEYSQEAEDILSSQRDCEVLMSSTKRDKDVLAAVNTEWWSQAEAQVAKTRDSFFSTQEVQKTLDFDIGSSRVKRSDEQKKAKRENDALRGCCYRYTPFPPTINELEESWTKYNLCSVVVSIIRNY